MKVQINKVLSKILAALGIILFALGLYNWFYLRVADINFVWGALFLTTAPYCALVSYLLMISPTNP